MKKWIILLLTLFSWQSIRADVVKVDEARRRAAEFFASVSGDPIMRKSGPDDFQLVYSFSRRQTKSASDPALYVFERGSGGYVVVSGDDVARPVLGYSLDGHFAADDMPESLQGMLQWYAEIIGYARERKWEAASKKAADLAGNTADSSPVQLVTARWSQGGPFNRLVPEINGEKPPIGCVPTAIAILMRYYRYPSKGTGTLPSYTYTKGGSSYSVPGHNLGFEYDWDLMPDDYRTSYTPEEADQLSRFLYDVAVMCQARFYPGGTSANVPNNARRLATYFGYDEKMQVCARSQGYSNEEWEQFVREEINSGRPVLYSGANDAGMGHALVIDGYRGQYYFSINLGWGWKNSAYYTITPIEGHESQLLMYYRNSYMVRRLIPKEPGEPNLYAEEVNFLPSEFVVGKDFSMANVVRNRAAFPVSLRLAYVMYDKNGSFKEMVSSDQILEFPAGGTLSVDIPTCRVSTCPSDGDAIVLSYQDPDTQVWVPIPQSRASKIIFSTSPIRSKAVVEYAPKLDRDICIKVYKDFSWELLREDGSSVFGDLAINEEKTGPGFSVIYTIIDYYDPASDKVRCRFWLDSGTYILRLTNPANGEEMRIKLVV